MDRPRMDSVRLNEVRRRAPKLSGAPLDYGMLGQLTGFSIKLAWILGYGLLARAFGDSGVTPLRFSMLELIGRNPGLQQIQLGQALGLSRSAATLAIDFWESRGCVERRTEPSDRRSFGVFATPAGAAELDRLRGLVEQADEALTESLSDAEILQLRALLAKIHL